MDRVAARFTHNMLNDIIHQESMEAGERWILNDVIGHPLYAWDSRVDRLRSEYDALRRRVELYLQDESGSESLVERTVYGETQANPERNNLRTRVVQTFDQAGVETTDEYDFKGNVLKSSRQLAEEYKTILSWQNDIQLEERVYCSTTTYDALNRPTETTAPDNSRTRRFYNGSSLLYRIEADICGENTCFVRDIQYNAKSQRVRIDFGNSVSTEYTYDPLTFELVQLKTIRNPRNFPDDCKNPPPAGWPGCQIQNMHFTIDPVGNIAHIRDDAQQTIYFRNQRVDPSCDYTYDPIYRLIEATGREHITLNDSHDFNTRFEHPNDGKAMCRYVERYHYDQVGNFLSVQHRRHDPANLGWTRNYEYNETSQVESGKRNNRLSLTRAGSVTESYMYDGNAGRQGNITSMTNLPLLKWSYRDQLRASARQVVREGLPETTWYVYDASGKRIRKVTERHAAPGEEPTCLKERIYIGEFGVFRKFNGNGRVTLERQTLGVMDDERQIVLVETRIQGEEPGIPDQLIRYQFDNHLSSISLELDDHGEIISYEEYTPYGATSYRISQTKIPKRYRYTGKERDEESGLYYYGERYYCALIGRWISCDPIGVKDGLNLYLFVSCNPVNLIDPDGACVSSRLRKRKSIDTTDPASTWKPKPKKPKNPSSLLPGTVTSPTRLALTATTPPASSSSSSSVSSSSSSVSSSSSSVSSSSTSVPSPSPNDLVSTLYSTGNLSYPSTTDYNLWIRSTEKNVIDDIKNKSDAGKYPWHHIFQQGRKYANFFLKFGINFNAVGVVIWIEDHKDIHSDRVNGMSWDQHWDKKIAEVNEKWKNETNKEGNFLKYQEDIVDFGIELLRLFTTRVSPDSISISPYMEGTKNMEDATDNLLKGGSQKNRHPHIKGRIATGSYLRAKLKAAQFTSSRALR